MSAESTHLEVVKGLLPVVVSVGEVICRVVGPVLIGPIAHLPEEIRILSISHEVESEVDRRVASIMEETLTTDGWRLRAQCNGVGNRHRGNNRYANTKTW